MKRESGLLLTLIILVAAMSVLSPYFLRTGNLLGLTRHLAEVGIIACAMTCIIATSGIDLSVGSLLGLTSIALGYASLAWDPASGIAIAFATGLLGGLFNGALIAHFALPPLVVTLATMALFRGLAMTISQAQPVSDVDLTRACIELSGARPQSSPPTASDLSAAIADFKQRQLRDLKRRTAERKVRNATNKLNLANRQIRVVRKVGSPEDLANWEKEAKIWEAKIAAAQAELDGILKPKAATPTAKRP